MAGPNGLEFQYTTKLFYMVHIRPKGPVPVLALEWQISNEVPNNLAALKKAAELVTPEYMQVGGGGACIGYTGDMTDPDVLCVCFFACFFACFFFSFSVVLLRVVFPSSFRFFAFEIHYNEVVYTA